MFLKRSRQGAGGSLKGPSDEAAPPTPAGQKRRSRLKRKSSSVGRQFVLGGDHPQLLFTPPPGAEPLTFINLLRKLSHKYNYQTQSWCQRGNEIISIIKSPGRAGDLRQRSAAHLRNCSPVSPDSGSSLCSRQGSFSLMSRE